MEGVFLQCLSAVEEVVKIKEKTNCIRKVRPNVWMVVYEILKKQVAAEFHCVLSALHESLCLCLRCQCVSGFKLSHTWGVKKKKKFGDAWMFIEK